MVKVRGDKSKNDFLREDNIALIVKNVIEHALRRTLYRNEGTKQQMGLRRDLLRAHYSDLCFIRVELQKVLSHQVCLNWREWGKRNN